DELLGRHSLVEALVVDEPDHGVMHLHSHHRGLLLHGELSAEGLEHAGECFCVANLRVHQQSVKVEDDVCDRMDFG
ncbi:hypothetical protein PMAYCL1PPCAC_26366, partial [Pristionchus mayeri]